MYKAPKNFALVLLMNIQRKRSAGNSSRTCKSKRRQTRVTNLEWLCLFCGGQHSWQDWHEAHGTARSQEDQADPDMPGALEVQLLQQGLDDGAGAQQGKGNHTDQQACDDDRYRATLV